MLSYEVGARAALARRRAGWAVSP